MPSESPTLLVFCIPIFNDWECAVALLEQIDQMAAQSKLDAAVLFIDDGSSSAWPTPWPAGVTTLKWAKVLQLRRNLGHQRAIAIGLTYIHVNIPCKAVVVMDGDGEDAPADVPKLLAEFETRREQKVIFAQRAKRSESLTFRVFYRLYQSAHKLLTGRRVEVGNFSIIPAKTLARLVGVGELWNHYAASVFKARLPHAKIPIARGHRLVGTSRMNFSNLVVHGLSAISVFGEEIGVRLLIAASVLIALTLAGLAAVIAIRFGTTLAVPGWATNAVGLLLVLFGNGLLLSLVFIFIILQTRSAMTFLPLRDYEHYVLDLASVVPQ
ncbi:N/A [soil metagenome]